jgi:hypothetical protein
MAEKTKRARTKKSEQPEAHVRGEVVLRPLSSVRPNGYNPNVMDEAGYASLKHGLVADGWIAAQALLVWGTDETGARQDLIVDGEHRWRAATELGMREGPMVVLDGLTRREAMALTVKLDSRRGSFAEDRLAAVLREVGAGPDVELDLGLHAPDVDRILREHPAPAPDLDAPAGVGDGVSAGPLVTGGESMEDFEDIELALPDLRAPFPWFGGKRRVAPIIWSALGNVKNYVEPFFGSGAVLLRRPGGRGPIETVNDADHYVSNVHRAIALSPDEVARWADWPVVEDDLHARHKWLLSREEWRQKMRDGDDPEYHDARVAGWWVWGACLWIGSGWCARKEAPEQVPHMTSAGMGVHARAGEQIVQLGNAGRGVASASALDPSEKIPHLSKGPTGVVSPSEKIPTLDATGKGVHRPSLSEQLPHLGGTGMDHGRGVDAAQASDTATGVNIRAWMRALSDRMRRVRVANGDFERVLTPAVTTGHGLTGVFLDPPYAEGADDLYGHHDKTVSARARLWALERGRDPLIRIAFCGYEGEHGPDPFPGWRCVRWKASGGYGNNGNEYRERIWLSAGCLPRGAQTGFEDAARAAE